MSHNGNHLQIEKTHFCHDCGNFIEDLGNHSADHSIDTKERYLVSSEAKNFIERIMTVEFETKLQAIKQEYNMYGWSDHIFASIDQFIEGIQDSISKTEDRFKKLVEEFKRIMIGHFFLMEVVSQGSTHKEKESHLYTAKEVLKNQLGFFERIGNNSKEFYRSWEGSGIIAHQDRIDEITELKNDRKSLHGQIKTLQEALNQKEIVLERMGLGDKQ